jgi:hypothetical protein
MIAAWACKPMSVIRCSHPFRLAVLPQHPQRYGHR